MGKSFKINNGKGFHLTFPNGVTFSTQFGPANYGDNYDSRIGAEKYDYESNEVEIAAWTKDNHWFDFEKNEFVEQSSDVAGYIPMDRWLEYLEIFKGYAQN